MRRRVMNTAWQVTRRRGELVPAQASVGSTAQDGTEGAWKAPSKQSERTLSGPAPWPSPLLPGAGREHTRLQQGRLQVRGREWPGMGTLSPPSHALPSFFPGVPRHQPPAPQDSGVHSSACVRGCPPHHQAALQCWVCSNSAGVRHCPRGHSIALLGLGAQPGETAPPSGGPGKCRLLPVL